MLPADRHQTVFPNGTLLISHVQREQNGSTYSCTAHGDRQLTATGSVNLKVIGELRAEKRLHNK